MHHIGWRRWALGCTLAMAVAIAGGCDGRPGDEQDTGGTTTEDASADGADGDSDGRNKTVQRCGQASMGGESADAGTGEDIVADVGGDVEGGS
ncbi:MAG: hypothetical protein ABEN55_09755, partial [Bradymonadaceae bacterium]